MKTDAELEQIVTNIAQRHLSHLFRDAAPHSIKELRSIQIDALRHAREIVDKAGDDDLGHACIFAELDKLVRELELR